MMFAARKLQGVGLIMLLTLCMLIAYPIWLQVSATRAELRQVELEIAQTRQQNRMLEGDIAVLANIHQLDRWNSEFFGYSAPTSSQYLAGERDLASLDSLHAPTGDAPIQPVLAALNDEPPISPTPGAGDAKPQPERVALLDRQQVTVTGAQEISRIIPSSTASVIATREVAGQ